MIVQVYKNLHKSKDFPVYSIRDKKTGRVIKHSPYVLLWNVKFTVQQAGRRKVIQQKRKNVHAFIEGELLSEWPVLDDLVGVTYNPYKNETFVIRQSGASINKARMASISASGIYVSI